MPSAARVTAIAAIVIAAFTACVLALKTPGESDVHFFEDDHDRDVYLQRGSFLPRHQVPFLEVSSEYPELATWFCAIPFLFIDAPSDAATYESGQPDAVKRHLAIFERYANIHSLEMAVLLLLLVFVSAKLCEHFQRDPRFALVAILPASLYFSLSRYDVLPVLLVSTSLLLLLKKRHLLAIFALSCAVLTKWYAILFLPFYLNYIGRRLGRNIVLPTLVSAVTAIAVVGTTFVSGGLRYSEIANGPNPRTRLAALPKTDVPKSVDDLVSKLPEGWRTFATGGFRAALAPYLHQGARISNPGGLYQQISQQWFEIPSGSATEAKILKILAALQFIIALFAFFVRMDDDEGLVRWMCLATAFFVLFAKFYSPQWVMWTNALALVFMRERLLVATAIALDLFIYAQFSIIRGTSLRGSLNPDQTWTLTPFWYHLYDVRIALTALFTLLVAWSLIGRRYAGGEPKRIVPA